MGAGRGEWGEGVGGVGGRGDSREGEGSLESFMIINM